jgi:hypothetical protein
MNTVQTAFVKVAAAVARRDVETAVSEYRHVTETMAALTLERFVGRGVIPEDEDEELPRFGDRSEEP